MIPPRDAAYALQTPVDQAITRLKTLNAKKRKSKKDKKASEELDKYIKAELSHISNISSIQQDLIAFQNPKEKLDDEVLLAEEHESKNLGLHMRAMGLAKPAPRWEAHAIISGAHGEADVLRAILALNEIRVDDPDNGAWLPKAERDKRGTYFPEAVVHGRIHRWHYYRWLEREITFEMNAVGIRKILTGSVGIRHQLQTSTFDSSVMKKKGEA